MSEWRSPVLSFRLDQKVPAIAALLFVFGFVAIVLNVGRGEYPSAVFDIVKTLLGINTGNPDHDFVIHTLR